PSGSSVTAASVANSVGENPARSSWNASAMVKHPACAAAISSSGFVPFSLSKRVLNEYGVADKTPESLDNSPLPVRPVPRQIAFALRITWALSSLCRRTGPATSYYSACSLRPRALTQESSLGASGARGILAGTASSSARLNHERSGQRAPAHSAD